MFNNDASLTSSDERQRISEILDVARMYYQRNMTQLQIAKTVGYSRPTVSRMLQEALGRGIVRITISDPLERLQNLESQLVSRFGLMYARVAEPPAGGGPIDVIPRCAASILVEHASSDSLVTVSNGRAVAATVREVPVQDWKKSTVAQMIGSLSPANPMTDSPEICRMLAQRLGGSYTTLPVPMILSSAPMARAMLKEKQIAATLALGGRADAAIVGVGAVNNGRSGHIFTDYEDAGVVEEITSLGAVGHICGHHIDDYGRHIRTSLCDRTVSIDFNRLKRIPLVIGVAWGHAKVRAIRACMRGGLISALATDRSTAEEILALDNTGKTADDER
ncbi:SorC family transcriptional regulator [Bifidobacterium actinocoloniiforme DSM 22766]|uniref:SorC family transcriptional regulator n=1 Tax=Bifidobacterium actinocoloniiforme DSM 22766 TaxID=1437605 RepID=A0A086Z2B3_9BIFI|nr:sugar-binding domain-containing protein [Bifidobacterium actinocoloniiforme]AKV55678.1 hypothetical protein AB656_05165 [Bifidobacterium actinocoloniiforme DSM 22766]KFI40663.1 SorC family transcriptional regulator [Bifidobacterium actinocoloniiforme DSM 22766]